MFASCLYGYTIAFLSTDLTHWQIRKLNQRQRGRGWSEAFLPEIDDQLPVSKDGRPLCASSRDFNVLWPALIEKAVGSDILISYGAGSSPLRST